MAKRTKELPEINSTISEKLTNSGVPRGMRRGVEIEKGVIVNEEFMTRNKEKLGDMFSFFTAYPDLFLDLIAPSVGGVKLFFYQRYRCLLLQVY